ncbi:hypothetical protein CANARDRAFT_21138 [[Candida] arabinofermentans NRRL YB-2248]|uniref:Uncharacterized protein n=1 Tax=[Candida] arabinofermentans NRRL YB-2248 TaxID=983967 RepID=A0A1E4T670_9ASCO|nr:hypothetical protein CANARDRAFT_21138 [[Candida] arabinofermentans NRRL YB-2248]
MTSESIMFTKKVAVLISFALSVYGSIFYFLFSHQGKHFQTPFSGIFIVTAIYWLLTFLLQLFFIIKVFFDKSITLEAQSRITDIVGSHFTINNICHFFWCYFFHRESFAVSECILGLNLLNLLTLYFHHKTMSIKNINDWVTIHFPVSAMPLSWTLYALFWNGACMFHSHNKSLFARILANLFIWEFLLVPGCFLLFYKDWSIGLSSSLLMLGLGFGQLFTKVVAFQWVFAFVISAVDFVASVLTMFGSGLTSNVNTGTSEQAPLLA